MELSAKQQQFNEAMEHYNSRSRYKAFGLAVSIINVSLQLYLLNRVWPQSIGVGQQILALILAYVITDFVNGLVHMYMDNNDRYNSPVGPLIANFHMHHKIPQYRKHNLLVVYFMESGSKIWLAGYLLAVLLLAGVPGLNPVALHILVYIGILSSFAEVSHYLCHSSTSPIVDFLGMYGLLLSKRHHARHHLQDNSNYAFLNGLSDPLINLIAAKYYKGYKHNTDLHFAHYVGLDGEDR
ncbi:MAG: sterol desaturase family protein [Deltaproteobacteria bacterium]|nr:sterol desaturase family protein [Deltaproteobacteria bacterium]